MHSAGFMTGQRGQTSAMRDGRHETELEAVDRQLDELLQEMRVVQTGVQVLFAFLLSVPFTQRFDTTSHAQQELYFATLLLAGAAVILLLAPTAWHRWLFRQHDKRHLVGVSHWFAAAGLVCVGLAVIGVVALIASFLFPGTTAVVATTALTALLILLWGVVPAARRVSDRRRHRRRRDPVGSPRTHGG